MFAVIVAGRPPLVEFTQIDETHVLFSLTNPEGINHIVVFMTGQVPFPEGYAGAVYLSLPSAVGDDRAWLYLGFISNSKPSALFKVCKFNAASDGSAMKGSMLNSVLPVSGVAQLGVSVEPETSIVSQTPVPGATPTNLDSFVVYTQKMLESFFNYAASFAVKPDTALLSSSDSYIPISILQRWYEQFLRRLQANPSFWMD